MQDYSGITMLPFQAVPGIDNWTFRLYLETLDRGGEKLQKQLEERSKRLEERKKPGKLCWMTCWIDDERCAACAAAQEKVYNGIDEVHQMEKALMYPELRSVKKCDKCTFCGAPYEPGETVCSYCGTEYPEGAVSIDLPTNPEELKRLMRRRAVEVWSLYPDVIVTQIKQLLNDATAADDLIYRVTYAMLSQNLAESYAMTLEQLEHGAEINAMSLSEYMMAVIKGQVEAESLKVVKAQREALNKQRREAMNAQHEREMASIERQKQANAEFWERYRRDHQPAGYGGGAGGSSSTCIDCTFYSAGAQKCAYFNKSTTAGDYCNRFRRK